MVAWRRAIELSLTDADTAKLRSIAASEDRPRHGRYRRAVTVDDHTLGRDQALVIRVDDRQAKVAFDPR